MNANLRFLFCSQTLLIACLLGLTSYFWGSAFYIYSKAQLAQILIAQSWQDTLQSPEQFSNHKPWSWADTWPVARLRWHNNKKYKDVFILAGANGTSLAFGPGHLSGTALPGDGFSVIAGHRDTHFSFLQYLARGDEFMIQSRNGEWAKFRVVATEIIDSSRQKLLIEKNKNVIKLVTCYPFDAVTPGGSLRYVVEAAPLHQGLAINVRFKQSSFKHFRLNHPEFTF